MADQPLSEMELETRPNAALEYIQQTFGSGHTHFPFFSVTLGSR
jgi:hypothetical protein